MANSGDDTVTRLDRDTGEPIGEPIKVGHNPREIAIGLGFVWVDQPRRQHGHPHRPEDRPRGRQRDHRRHAPARDRGRRRRRVGRQPRRRLGDEDPALTRAKLGPPEAATPAGTAHRARATGPPRDCVPCPAPGTGRARPRGASCASACAHSIGVERSRSPASSSTGTARQLARPPAAAAARAPAASARSLRDAVVRRGRAVVRVDVGRLQASRPRARAPRGARRAARTRRPTGARRSPHSVDACRPWLRKPPACAALGARRRTIASSSPWPPGAASRSAGDPRKLGATTLSAVSVSSSSTPSWRCAIDRREVVGRVARAVQRLHASRRTRAVARIGDEAQRVDVVVRHDRVEHEPLARGRGARARSARRRRCRRRRRRARACRRRARRAAARGRRRCRRSCRSAALAPSVAAQRSTVPAAGVVRSELPIERCSAGQRSAVAAGAALVDQ